MRHHYSTTPAAVIALPQARISMGCGRQWQWKEWTGGGRGTCKCIFICWYFPTLATVLLHPARARRVVQVNIMTEDIGQRNELQQLPGLGEELQYLSFCS